MIPAGRSKLCCHISFDSFILLANKELSCREHTIYTLGGIWESQWLWDHFKEPIAAEKECVTEKGAAQCRIEHGTRQGSKGKVNKRTVGLEGLLSIKREVRKQRRKERLAM